MHKIVLFTPIVIFFHILISSNTLVLLNNYVKTNLVISNSPSFKNGGVIFIPNNSDFRSFTNPFSLPIKLCNLYNEYDTSSFIISPGSVSSNCNFSVPIWDSHGSFEYNSEYIYDILLMCIIILLTLIFTITIVACVLNLDNLVCIILLLILIIMYLPLSMVQINKADKFIDHRILNDQPKLMQDMNISLIDMMYISTIISSCITICYLIFNIVNHFNNKSLMVITNVQ